MKVLVSASIFLFSILSWAGDGGFDLWTCTSNSGRTNLTIYSDNLSDAKVPMKVVFGIDGQFVTYEHYRYDINRPEEEICQDDCTQVTFEQQRVTVNNGEFVSLQVDLNNNKATILKGFVDPRPDYKGSDTGSIQLTCKHFHQEP